MIRVDEEDVVFTHREAKEAAVAEGVRRVHATGRPVLVGTLTIVESERLAERLREWGVECRVLNARNDEMEAHIVSGAGALGAVTISTNMAGRGTDIRLGGEDESDRAAVVALGGLYVIGTNRHESRRIDLLLRGRAGRQGDPGTSRLFVSLEDDLLVRYGVDALIPAGRRPPDQAAPIESATVRREIARAQRIIEGQNLEIRRTLWRYASVVEENRRRVQARRQALLLGTESPDIWADEGAPYEALVEAAGADAVRRAEVLVTLAHIDRAWSDYLSFLADVREGIHLVGLGGQDPLSRFKVQAAEAFEAMQDDVAASVRASLAQVRPGAGGLDLSHLALKGPASTWTYLVNDDPFRNQLGAMLMGPGKTTYAMGGAMFAAPLLILLGLVDRYLRKRPHAR
jgi:preprotein translocase subunit SecA